MIDISDIDYLYARIESNGTQRFVHFYDKDPSNDPKILLRIINKTNYPLVTIVGLWTEHDIQKILIEVKKGNPKLKECKIL